jgi:hypothetical protein
MSWQGIIRNRLIGLGEYSGAIQILAACVTAGATVALWCVTAEYIEVTAKTYRHEKSPIMLVSLARLTANKEARVLRMEIVAKNYGTGLTYDGIAKCVWFINGSKSSGDRGNTADEPMIGGPQTETIINWGEMSDPEYSALMAGTMSWEIACDLDYRDFDGRGYHSHGRFRFIPPMGTSLPPRLSITTRGCKDDQGRECGKD